MDLSHRRRRRPAKPFEDEGDANSELSLADLGLSVRTINTLEAHSIHTAADVLKRTRAELLAVKNLGAKTLGEISRRLKARGFQPNW